MSCETNISFELSNILDDDDFHINDFSEISLHASPVKRSPKTSQDNSPVKPATSLNSTSYPDLSLLKNELFQVTHHLRSRAHVEGPDKQLRDDKIEKLLDDLENENNDFELDDQLRTRVFRARLKNQSTPDDLDFRLDSYLQDRLVAQLPKRGKRGHDENKENSSALQPPKKTKLSGKPRPKRSLSSIPLLQPLSNVTDLCSNTQARSPQRICVPRKLAPPRPSLKQLQKEPVQIYMVESLTGLINDATQFGTELNASNCEGFLMPDNINEIVQIPTNEVGPSAKKKLAIIKAHHSKRFTDDQSDLTKSRSGSPGFYLKQEFEKYRELTPPSQVQVHRDKKAVRWADELEW